MSARTRCSSRWCARHHSTSSASGSYGVVGQGAKLRLPREVLERGVDQLVLGPEMAEQGHLVDAGFLGDAPGGGAAHAGFGEDLDGGFEERVRGRP